MNLETGSAALPCVKTGDLWQKLQPGATRSGVSLRQKAGLNHSISAAQLAAPTRGRSHEGQLL